MPMFVIKFKAYVFCMWWTLSTGLPYVTEICCNGDMLYGGFVIRRNNSGVVLSLGGGVGRVVSLCKL